MLHFTRITRILPEFRLVDYHRVVGLPKFWLEFIIGIVKLLRADFYGRRPPHPDARARFVPLDEIRILRVCQKPF